MTARVACRVARVRRVNCCAHIRSHLRRAALPCFAVVAVHSCRGLAPPGRSACSAGVQAADFGGDGRDVDRSGGIHGDQ